MAQISFESVRKVLLSALHRFPLVILAGVIGATAMVVLNHSDSEAVKETATRVGYAMGFAFPLFVAAVYAGELFPCRRWLFQVAAVLGVWAYGQFLDPEREGLTLLLVGIAAVSVASAVPGLVKESGKNWWRVNIGTLNAIVLAQILTLVVLVGLLLAVESIKALFDLELQRIPGDVIAVCVFLIAPLAVTALLPAARAELDATQPGFAVWGRLCQWALVPMGFLFTGILTAYAVRIVIERAMPDGMVALPVLVLGCYGLAALCLLEPWRDERKWARAFARIFPVVFPLFSILLFLALARRIDDYGFTFQRYTALALAVWISVCCLVLLVRRSVPLAFAPALLAVAALIAAFGPLSSQQVCLRSQSYWLKQLLAERSEDNADRIASSLRYIAFNYDQATVEKFTGPLDLEKDASTYEVAKAARKKLGLPELNYDGSVRVEFDWPEKKPIPVQGYRFLHKWNRGSVSLGPVDLMIQIRDGELAVWSGSKKLHIFDLAVLDPSKAESAEAPPSFDWNHEGREFRIILLSAEWAGAGKEARLTGGDVLVLEK